ncbi:NAD(P)/FAD-dependent oxidoreductase [Brevundimonas halotolerans]|uniref:3-phenylpropionate/trans-cinnamate dioxygenase ferredoxin reductase subunit n=1 Tax=Brevundimonas halotolerans TaxID=69670 RepID=A0A7W9A348_9CAUL|nr:FAD-dependent oxidoreductase [Brevundimonas halotolerans]MBB5660574.1 3-phenylpropionate/trans-cinnamate dioxygenase ferredoxin reductase subunit [Brevundimonas halotolerans]
MSRIVIVGAGHAGGSAAALLRQYGFDGEVVLIGEEPVAPYQRPPLSKALLKGEGEEEDLLLRPADFYVEQNIQMRLGQTVTAIDRAGKQVVLSDGETVAYDTLILATGSTARKLDVPGADLTGVLELRTLVDARRLRAAIKPGVRLAVVGGGYVGLEVAASARALGAEVVVIEREARLLARVASEVLADFMHDAHSRQGVTLLTGRTVVAFQPGEDGSVAGVTLDDGQSLPADLAIVGVGGVACEGLGAAAGLTCDGGVVVDETARTSDPHIYALGDMTRRPVPVHDGRIVRLESVPNALEQAKQAAAAITGRKPPPPEVPWFWSDQYDLKLQMAGLSDGADRKVVRGDPTGPGFAVFHLAGDRLLCVEAVNAPAEFMGGRLVIAKATPVDAEKLADPSVSMKAVAKA